MGRRSKVGGNWWIYLFSSIFIRYSYTNPFVTYFSSSDVYTQARKPTATLWNRIRSTHTLQIWRCNESYIALPGTDHHDDVIKWKHFPSNWPFARGIHRPTGEFPTQRPVTRSFDVFLAATKQLNGIFCPSVRLSICLSVCPSVCLSVCPSVTPFWLCSHHRIIIKFSGVIKLDQGKDHAKGPGQRSKVRGHRGHDPNFRFRTVTPVWIHIWW